MRVRGEEEGSLSIYVHVPYCTSKCPYCDFASRTAKGPVPDREYAACILKEFETVPAADYVELDGMKLESLYVGGGTPTAFPARSVAGIIGAVTERFGASGRECEITVEANPGTVSPRYFRDLKKAGANRLSIGVQSFDDSMLGVLGRSHSGEKARAAFADARDAGFGNIGVDLIFGLPGQDRAVWERDLEEAVRLAPEHVSVYALTIEEGTPFSERYGGAGAAELPGDDEVAWMFKAAVRALSGAGFSHYEISNFARPGCRSVHNEGYWLGRNYVGLGAGAHSYYREPGWGKRLWNEKDPDAYMEAVTRTGTARVGGEELTAEDAATEAVFLGLRMLERGIRGEEFKERFGLPLKEVFPGITRLIEEGFLREEGHDVLLTPEGVLMADEVVLGVLGHNEPDRA